MQISSSECEEEEEEKKTWWKAEIFVYCRSFGGLMSLFSCDGWRPRKSSHSNKHMQVTGRNTYTIYRDSTTALYMNKDLQHKFKYQKVSLYCWVTPAFKTRTFKWFHLNLRTTILEFTTKINSWNSTFEKFLMNYREKPNNYYEMTNNSHKRSLEKIISKRTKENGNKKHHTYCARTNEQNVHDWSAVSATRLHVFGNSLKCAFLPKLILTDKRW